MRIGQVGAGDATYNVAFDFDGKGVVGTLDYGQFRARFGRSLFP